MNERTSLGEFRRPSEEDERRALVWLTDVRASGGPLERTYAASIIETLAWFEKAKAHDDFDPAADSEVPDVHDDPSWGPESAARFGHPGHQHHRARDGKQA
jgi:hypothetical protein